MAAPPETANNPRPADPALASGNVGDPVSPCDRNDVEVVNDLEEPNSIEMESEVEDEDFGGLVFAATVEEPGGNKFAISEESFDDEDDSEQTESEVSGLDGDDSDA